MYLFQRRAAFVGEFAEGAAEVVRPEREQVERRLMARIFGHLLTLATSAATEAVGSGLVPRLLFMQYAPDTVGSRLDRNPFAG